MCVVCDATSCAIMSMWCLGAMSRHGSLACCTYASAWLASICDITCRRCLLVTRGNGGMSRHGMTPSPSHPDMCQMTVWYARALTCALCCADKVSHVSSDMSSSLTNAGWMSHVPHTNESCRVWHDTVTCRWRTKEVEAEKLPSTTCSWQLHAVPSIYVYVYRWMSHVPHTNESCPKRSNDVSWADAGGI